MNSSLSRKLFAPVSQVWRSNWKKSVARWRLFVRDLRRDKQLVEEHTIGQEGTTTDVEIELPLLRKDLSLLSLVWLVAFLDNIASRTGSPRTARPGMACIA